MVNDFQAPHPLKKGCPPGHATLTKYLTLPVVSDGKIVAVVGVANKDTDYDDGDVRQLTLMMDAVWQTVERRRINLALKGERGKISSPDHPDPGRSLSGLRGLECRFLRP